MILGQLILEIFFVTICILLLWESFVFVVQVMAAIFLSIRFIFLLPIKLYNYVSREFKKAG